MQGKLGWKPNSSPERSMLKYRQRCEAKKIPCTIPRKVSSDTQDAQSFFDSTRSAETPGSRYSDISAPLYSNAGDVQELSNQELVQLGELNIDRNLPDVSGHSITGPVLNSFPVFFEQVMLPGTETDDNFHEMQQPRVLEFWQDQYFNNPDEDVFGADFIPDLNQFFDLPTLPSLPVAEDIGHTPPDSQESTRYRAAAFQRSLWCVENLSAFLDYLLIV